MAISDLTNRIENFGPNTTNLKYQLIKKGTNTKLGKSSGVDIMNLDWDNLIILDGCRYDVFSAVNELPGTVQRKISRGASTPEFLENNFAQRTAYDTVYISANAMVGELAGILEVYKLIGLWDEETRVKGQANYRKSHIHPASIPEPKPVVDRTLDLRNEFPNKKLITHFLQPHTPFLVHGGKRLQRDSPLRTYKAAAEGEVPERKIRTVYEENVKFVLEYVKDLLKQLRGKTVVTADHGELLGEGVPSYVELLHPRWSFSERHRFDYGHYRGVRVPELVHIPWLTIESDDRPDIIDEGSSAGVKIDESSIEDHLKALGYK